MLHRIAGACVHRCRAGGSCWMVAVGGAGRAGAGSMRSSTGGDHRERGRRTGAAATNDRPMTATVLAPGSITGSSVHAPRRTDRPPNTPAARWPPPRELRGRCDPAHTGRTPGLVSGQPDSITKAAAGTPHSQGSRPGEPTSSVPSSAADTSAAPIASAAARRRSAWTRMRSNRMAAAARASRSGG